MATSPYAYGRFSKYPTDLSDTVALVDAKPMSAQRPAHPAPDALNKLAHALLQNLPAGVSDPEP